MELVRDTVLSLRISQHASVALAYRYGIICQASTINFYYQCIPSAPVGLN